MTAPCPLDSVPVWAQESTCPRVERYLLGPELGRGGMGRVHAAWDPLLRRAVALKLLSHADPEQHVRMLREAHCQARLDHPTICRIYDQGMDGQYSYIAMQYLEGRPFGTWRPELTVRQVVELLATVASAVHAAHAAGMIHRDLKPSNIMVGRAEDGSLHPTVVDFGLAKDFRAADLTLTWACLGTPAFMSPEQAKGEALGPATDIYSLGASLYTLLCGRPPFDACTLGGLVTQQAQADPAPLHCMDPRLPRDLTTIAMKALESEPARRYTSAEALAEDLRRWLRGEPVLARPVGTAGRAWRWVRRRPALAAALGGSLLVAGSLGLWNLHLRQQSRAREQAAQRFGMEIRDAEHLLRIEHMLPEHDLRPAEGRLRARMETIRGEMERLDGATRGPGLYAIGRGHLALREYDAALRTLGAAWDTGYRAPEVAYALGTAILWKHMATYGDQLAQGNLAWKRTRTDWFKKAETWMSRSTGASVDQPEVGRALLAWARGKFEEADQRFERAFEQSPWAYEALVGRGINRFDSLYNEGAHDPTSSLAAKMPQAFAFFDQAARLAPSDPEVLHAQCGYWAWVWILESSNRSRNPQPLERGLESLERLRKLQREDPTLQLEAGNLAIQLGFFELGVGKDPAARCRDMLRRTEPLQEAKVWDKPENWTRLMQQRHYLSWITADADQRYGREAGPALEAAAQARNACPVRDLHGINTLLLQAEEAIRRRQDPSPHFDAAESWKPESEEGTWFDQLCFSEPPLERALWRFAHGLSPDTDLVHASNHLGRALRLNTEAAYIYYDLPRLHALRARLALARGQDGRPEAQEAVTAARKGISINPANAQLQWAAAVAFHAEGSARNAAGEDPAQAWTAARSALDAAERINPRYFKTCLTRAELEAEAAHAGDITALSRARRACRRGLAIKRDEPRFYELLQSLGRPLIGEQRRHPIVTN